MQQVPFRDGERLSPDADPDARSQPLRTALPDPAFARTRQKSPRFRLASPGAPRPNGRPQDYDGVRFDLSVAPGGYAWWYADALSDDGAFGLTMIAFVGSVFSPYYAWSGRQRPDNHCALNVALYGPRGARWTMTERGAAKVSRSDRDFQIARSSLEWRGDDVVIRVDERAAPFPHRVRGEIRIRTSAIGDNVFYIDDRGRHRWRPLSPSCRIEVDFEEPSISWAGHGYFDANDGDEPLEDAFDYWDWSRTTLDGRRTAILYNTDLSNGESRTAAMLIDRNGDVRDFDTPRECALPPTPIWRIRRRAYSEGGAPARVIQSLEDTPFYSRSVIETRLFGADRRAVHESLSGPRLSMPIVKGLLPFRMPRIA